MRRFNHTQIQLIDSIVCHFFFYRVEDGCWSRDEGHPNDEDEAFNFTSLSDAMIDDEIADQPNLVMLGQVGLLLLFLSFPVIFISFLFDSHCRYQHHRCARGDQTCSITLFRLPYLWLIIRHQKRS